MIVRYSDMVYHLVVNGFFLVTVNKLVKYNEHVSEYKDGYDGVLWLRREIITGKRIEVRR